MFFVLIDGETHQKVSCRLGRGFSFSFFFFSLPPSWSSEAELSSGWWQLLTAFGSLPSFSTPGNPPPPPGCLQLNVMFLSSLRQRHSLPLPWRQMHPLHFNSGYFSTLTLSLLLHKQRVAVRLQPAPAPLPHLLIPDLMLLLKLLTAPLHSLLKWSLRPHSSYRKIKNIWRIFFKDVSWLRTDDFWKWKPHGLCYIQNRLNIPVKM